VTSWIEDNISRNTGYVGRVNSEFSLKELNLFECVEFFKARKTGYRPETNIKLLFQTEGAFFTTEFEKIFSDIFQRRGALYQKILSSIIGERLAPVALAARLGLQLNGDFSRALMELELAGSISRDFTWSFNQGISKLSHLRLCDNYFRFYLRYVKKHKARFKKLPLAKTEMTSIGNWDAIIGLQFENVVMNSLSLIIDALGFAAADIENVGPFFQPATRGRRGVQIDLLIQTRSRTLHIVEIEASKSLGLATIDGARRKLARLQKTRGYAILPSLITIHPVPSTILDSDFFYRTVNLTELCFDKK
jgi:hypothetical protein